jgi:hypothetical protein
MVGVSLLFQSNFTMCSNLTHSFSWCSSCVGMESCLTILQMWSLCPRRRRGRIEGRRD